MRTSAVHLYSPDALRMDSIIKGVFSVGLKQCNGWRKSVLLAMSVRHYFVILFLEFADGLFKCAKNEEGNHDFQAKWLHVEAI